MPPYKLFAIEYDQLWLVRELDLKHSSKHTNPVARFEAEKQWLLSPVLQTCFAWDKVKANPTNPMPWCDINCRSIRRNGTR